MDKQIDDLDALLEELDGNEKAAPEERPLNQEEACGFLDASQRYSNTYLVNDDTANKIPKQNIYTIFTDDIVDNFLFDFLKENKCMDERHGFLQDDGRGLNGDFTKVKNYWLDCILQADIENTDKLFLIWVFRHSKGFYDSWFLIWEGMDVIAEQIGVTKRTLYRIYKRCIKRNVIKSFKRTVKRFRKEQEVEVIKLNPFPNKWLDVGSRPTEYMKNWVEKKRKNLKIRQSKKV
ncbi:MAG: hypothetical protein ACW990_17550 [Promethearchaeota archaeon]|jgi:hypothetical protein